ncbi:MAG: DUF4912 domain-containing protein [Halarcobacter sp.]
MNENAKKLINESLEIEDDFSSSSHIINSIASDIIPMQNSYDIPVRYNKNRLVILLVNTTSYYIYWEVDDNTIEVNNIDLNKDKLYFKLYDINGELLNTFESSFALGEHFIKEQFEDLDIYVKLYILKDDKLVELLTSNTIHTFSTTIKIPDEEDEIWIKRTKGWTEIIRSSMQHFTLGMSSAKYVEEIEQLREFDGYDKQNQSSYNLHKGNEND